MNSNLHVDETVIRQFCRKWRIRELSLFGSALRDDFNPQSDFDFLVSFEPEATWDLFDLIAMKTEMTLCGRRWISWKRKHYAIPGGKKTSWKREG